MPIDYEQARCFLEEILRQVEADLIQNIRPEAPDDTSDAFKAVFESNTQSFREVLVGCAIARIQDKNLDIRLPYVNLGERAFNGRDLDERVINPFLHDNRIPSSTGPYLAKFRRSVRFDESTVAGTRDVRGYRALLQLIGFIESISMGEDLDCFVRYLLYKFVELREASRVSLSRLQRMSLEQYDTFISGLLTIPSGGRIAVFLVLSVFNAIREHFGLNWTIDFQGINVADAAAGAGGDITIKRGDEIVLAAEVTERPVDRNRVATTFNAKIAPNGIEDYLFFVNLATVAPEAKDQTRHYFTQGHEVNFLEMKDWILAILATLGKDGRERFFRHLLAFIEAPDVPRSMKVGWNRQVERLVAG
jgi:hypothetical protein